MVTHMTYQRPLFIFFFKEKHESHAANPFRHP
jgi:hypothetical protein